MERHQTLKSFLADWAGTSADGDNATNLAIAETINKLCGAAASIADLIAQGSLAGEMAAIVGDNADGDAQKFLDVKSNELIFGALRDSPVAVMGSEEDDEAVALNEGAPLAVAVDPLDGSSNIETNVSIGTIFSIFPVATARDSSPAKVFYQPAATNWRPVLWFMVPRPPLSLPLVLAPMWRRLIATRVSLWSR